MFTINCKYYNQNRGLFIGVPTSPCFAEIYIQRVEENIYTMLIVPPLWYRKVNDTFAITHMILERHCKS